MRQFALFCVAGALAFVVDAGIVQVLVGMFGVDPIIARIPSFTCAVSCTWLFNRRYTFVPSPDVSLLREWMNYVVSQLAGLTVNFVVYAVLVLTLATARQWPALAVAAGACVALVVNFFAARHLVFGMPARRDRQMDPP